MCHSLSLAQRRVTRHAKEQAVTEEGGRNMRYLGRQLRGMSVLRLFRTLPTCLSGYQVYRQGLGKERPCLTAPGRGL